MLQKKTLFLLFFLMLIHGNQLFAQPEPCLDSIPDMTPLCADACIICDIDGFTGRHESNIAGEAPDDFCTFVVHNAQWIAFIAGSEELTVEIEVSNCDIGGGLEIAIYESLDCETFTIVSNCFGAQSAVSQGSSGLVVANTALTIGQYYYIVMDGQMGDNCDWTLNVINGDTQVAPLTTSGFIEGELEVCPGITTTYETQAEEGATIFDWELNGQSIQGDGATTFIDWTTDGTYQLCVTARNACDEAPPTCQIIEVISIEPQFLEEKICGDDCFMLNDSIELCDAGDYEFNFLTAKGCDSTIFVNLEVVQESTTNLDIDICVGDSIFIGANPYFQTGIFTEVLENYLGCDSTIILDLFTIVCEIQGESEENPVVCFGESSGEINFYIEDGTPPFNYSWEKLGGSPSGNGMINNINENELIPNLPVGTYLITINDNFDNDLIIIQEVTQPNVLTVDFMISDYNNFNISCNAGNDGTLEIIPVGGVNPYIYEWSNGEQGAVINDLSAGDYSVTITDAYGCSISASNTLNEPTLFSFLVDFSNPNCDGFDTGNIAIQNISGGVQPYVYQNSGNGFVDDDSFQNLTEGTYEIIAQDANGCEIDTTATLVAPIIPIIDLGENLTVDLGDDIPINVSSNIFLDSVIWSNEFGLSCYGCPEPNAGPYQDTEYLLTVISPDDCITTDSITIFVNERRRVHIPNVFSPNNDGINDYFTIFGGIEVLTVRQFTVFSRWGNLVFEQTNFPVNAPNMGWNGKFKGEGLQADVYVWFAEVEFIDGEIIQYKGDVMVMR